MQIIDHGGARIAALHDKKTGSWQYVVSDPVSRKCAIIDPVWDFDEKAAATSTRNADAILDYVKAEGLTVEWLLDTHPPADHFSAAPYLKDRLAAPHCDRRKGHWRPEAVEGHLRPGRRLPDRRAPVGPSLPGR